MTITTTSQMQWMPSRTMKTRQAVDTDGDGVGNNADTDDDNDGVNDSAGNPVNVALGKPATQSSIYPHSCYPTAAKAVDGNTNGIFYPNCSVTHTNSDPQAWWQVDLQAVYPLDTITLWNRTDCCGDRLTNFDVLISQDGTSWSTFNYPGTALTLTTFNINASARYVKVQLRGTNSP